MNSENLVKIKNIINFEGFFKGILIVFSYFIMMAIFSIPFLFLFEKELIGMELANIGIYFLLTLFYSLIYRKELIKDFKDFKKNYKDILKTTFKFWLVGFIIMSFSSLVISYLNIDANLNQEENINMLKSMPLVEVLCACLFAPITEELVFRRGLKNLSSNKHIYAIISGLIFAFLHVFTSINDINSLIMFIYIIPYGALGIVFGYAYRKTDNIYGTMIMHALHNAISLTEILLIGCIL